MKSRHILLAGGILLAAGPARAHFALNQPLDALQGGGLSTDAGGNGNPTGGDQKTEPCGTGTASGLVTQVRAGATQHVRVTETIAHGGHYRIAFSANRNDFVDPVVTGTCASAAIQGTPVAPVLADGLFVHTQAQAANGTVYETDVTIPATAAPGMYTLQVLEFMTPHAAPCFYYHCATIQVVAPDAGINDSGVVVTDGGGGGGGDSGGGGGGDSGGGGNTGGGDSGGGGNTGGGGNRSNPSAPNTSDGCSVSSGTGASLAVPAIGAIAALAMLRRRRKSR
jgi:MYXO-CTERM domain-containing protein